MIKRVWFGAAGDPFVGAPLRVTVSCVQPETRVEEYDEITIAWFTNPEHLARAQPIGNYLDVEEHVVRGADWLDHCWVSTTPKLKQLALAVRADHLSAAEFSAAWRSHAGRVTTNTQSVEIPAAARGSAYVQNHPVPGHDWSLDALNEVYLDDRAALETRMKWFEENPSGNQLFKESRFIVVLEKLASE